MSLSRDALSAWCAGVSGSSSCSLRRCSSRGFDSVPLFASKSRASTVDSWCRRPLGAARSRASVKPRSASISSVDPSRDVKRLADECLGELTDVFDKMYARIGRPSIPPERLLKSMLLMALYSINSERMLYPIGEARQVGVMVGAVRLA